MTNHSLREELPEEAIIFTDASYDESIIGVTTDNRIVYSYERMVEEFMNDNNCSIEEAIDWIDYNSIRALSYCGDNAPIIMYQI